MRATCSRNLRLANSQTVVASVSPLPPSQALAAIAPAAPPQPQAAGAHFLPDWPLTAPRYRICPPVLAPLDRGCLDNQRSANARGMAPCFFAIAGTPPWSNDLADTPLPKIFLDEKVVLFRTASGRPAALADQCCPRLPVAIAIAVALDQPVGRAFAERGSSQPGHFHLHQPLGRKADHVAQNVGVGGLLHERAKRRWFLGCVGGSQPDPTGESSMTAAREATRPLRRYGGRACGRLRYRPATPPSGTRPGRAGGPGEAARPVGPLTRQKPAMTGGDGSLLCIHRRTHLSTCVRRVSPAILRLMP